MALNLSGIKEEESASSSVSSSSQAKTLNTSSLSVASQSEAAASTSTVSSLNLSSLASSSSSSSSSSLILKFTDKNVYDLDAMISELRQNPDSPLYAAVESVSGTLAKIYELATKDILTDYGVAWTNDDYASKVSEVLNFKRIFEIYFRQYYAIYQAELAKAGTEGSVSIEDAASAIEATRSDVRKYLSGSSEPGALRAENIIRVMGVWSQGSSSASSISDLENSQLAKAVSALDSINSSISLIIASASSLVAAEASARKEADAGVLLSAQGYSDNNFISAKAYADSVASAAFSSAVSTAASALSSASDSLTALVGAERARALKAEAGISVYSAANRDLISANASSISLESQARKSEDARVLSEGEAYSDARLSDAKAYSDSGISSASAALETRIHGVETTASNDLSQAVSDAKSRESGIQSSLENKINSLTASQIAASNGSLPYISEATDVQGSLTKLAQALESGSSSQIGLASAISAEASARSAADDAERIARTNADNSLSASIISEASARQALAASVASLTASQIASSNSGSYYISSKSNVQASLLALDSGLAAVAGQAAAAFVYKGKVATKSALSSMTGMEVGNVWVVESDESTTPASKNVDYVWNGSAWDDLGHDVQLASESNDGLMSKELVQELNSGYALAQSNASAIASESSSRSSADLALENKIKSLGASQIATANAGSYFIVSSSNAQTSLLALDSEAHALEGKVVTAKQEAIDSANATAASGIATALSTAESYADAKAAGVIVHKASRSDFPKDAATGNDSGSVGSLYVDLSSGDVYYWTDSDSSFKIAGRTAYSHSQIADGSNPHKTTFANILSKPTTVSGYGITDAYTKAEIDSSLSSASSSIASEASARKAEDDALQSQITSVSASLSQEILDRKSADSGLLSNILDNKTAISSNTVDIQANKKSADDSISALSSSVSANAKAISDETARAEAAEALKQDALTFDSAPKAGSSNPVTSGGLYSAIPSGISLSASASSSAVSIASAILSASGSVLSSSSASIPSATSLSSGVVIVDQSLSLDSANPVQGKIIKKAIDDEASRASSAEAAIASRVGQAASLGPDGTTISAYGIAPLGTDAKVPAAYLPSYVDDVVEGYLSEGKFYSDSGHMTAISGESGKIYVDLLSSKTYRWSGTQFSVISETLALGESETSAYRGDYGKIAYDHSQIADGSNPHKTTFANIESKPTTVSGYGISDAYTKAEVDASLKAASDSASAEYLKISGGTMTGVLTMSASSSSGIEMSGKPISQASYVLINNENSAGGSHGVLTWRADGSGYDSLNPYNGEAYITGPMSSIGGGQAKGWSRERLIKESEFNASVSAVSSHADSLAASLQTQVSANSSSISSLYTALSSEASSRESGDASAVSSANSYSDSKYSSAVSHSDSNLAIAEGYADTKSSNALSSANSYTNSSVAAALSSANSYSDSRVVIVASAEELAAKSDPKVVYVRADTWDAYRFDASSGKMRILGKTAYDHSQTADGSNPHKTTFANIESKPTTLSGYGITDAYTKEQSDAGSAALAASLASAISDRFGSITAADVKADNSGANYISPDLDVQASLLELDTAIKAVESGAAVAFVYKGKFATKADLIASGSHTQGYVYVVESDESTSPASSNVDYVWNGTDWDDLGHDVKLATASNDGLMSSAMVSQLAGAVSGVAANAAAISSESSSRESSDSALEAEIKNNSSAISAVSTALSAEASARITNDAAVTSDAHQYSDARKAEVEGQIGASSSYSSSTSSYTYKGIAQLGTDGKLLDEETPDGYSKTLWYDTDADRPSTGETGRLYVASNSIYGWDGEKYVKIAGALEVGERSDQAFRGDYGKIAYDHSQLADGSNPHQTTFANILAKPGTVDALNSALGLSGDGALIAASAMASSISSEASARKAADDALSASIALKENAVAWESAPSSDSSHANGYAVTSYGLYKTAVAQIGSNKTTSSDGSQYEHIYLKNAAGTAISSDAFALDPATSSVYGTVKLDSAVTASGTNPVPASAIKAYADAAIESALSAQVVDLT